MKGFWIHGLIQFVEKFWTANRMVAKTMGKCPKCKKLSIVPNQRLFIFMDKVVKSGRRVGMMSEAVRGYVDNYPWNGRKILIPYTQEDGEIIQLEVSLEDEEPKAPEC